MRSCDHRAIARPGTSADDRLCSVDDAVELRRQVLLQLSDKQRPRFSTVPSNIRTSTRSGGNHRGAVIEIIEEMEAERNSPGPAKIAKWMNESDKRRWTRCSPRSKRSAPIRSRRSGRRYSFRRHPFSCRSAAAVQLFNDVSTDVITMALRGSAAGCASLFSLHRARQGAMIESDLAAGGCRHQSPRYRDREALDHADGDSPSRKRAARVKEKEAEPPDAPACRSIAFRFRFLLTARAAAHPHLRRGLPGSPQQRALDLAATIPSRIGSRGNRKRRSHCRLLRSLLFHGGEQDKTVKQKRRRKRRFPTRPRKATSPSRVR